MLNYFNRETMNGESIEGIAKLQNVLLLYMVSVLGKTQNLAMSHGLDSVSSGSTSHHLRAL
jgi:hypothetical protein